jgi:hypothetical protein
MASPNMADHHNRNELQVFTPENYPNKHGPFSRIGHVAVGALATMSSYMPAAESVVAVAQTAPIATLVAADSLGGFDVITVGSYQRIDNDAHTGSKNSDTLLAAGGSSLVGLGISLPVGLAITRNRKLKDLFKNADGYREHKRRVRGPIRNGIVDGISKPFEWLELAGNYIEKKGDKLSEGNAKLLKGLGHLTIDSGKVLAYSSNGEVWMETGRNKPPSDRRNVWLGLLGLGVLQGAIKGAREVNQNVPGAHYPMNVIARGFDYATNLNLTHPWETPISLSAISMAAAGLAWSGISRAEYNRKHPVKEQPTTEPPLNQSAA